MRALLGCAQSSVASAGLQKGRDTLCACSAHCAHLFITRACWMCVQGPVETPVASADGAQAGVFSPVFHCMRTLRSSLEATQAPDATHTYEHPAEEDGQDEHHSQWVEQQQADVEHRDVTNTVLASPAQAFHPHHPQPDEHHQDEHHHHTMVPEAVEHELPADQTAEVDEELDYMEFDPLLFIKLLPPLEQVRAT